MLIGMGRKKPETAPQAAPAATPAAPGAAPVIFDAGVQDFEQRVIHASMTTPVLVDFWAPWCGPCKQLGPVLEQAVTAAGGGVLLAKINIDDNPELAQALRVQSVPTVYAFFQGQPVTAFAGARPASEIKALIDQLVQLAGGPQPGAIDIPAVLGQAALLLGDGKMAEAQDLYIAVLEQDEQNVQAYTGLVRVLIAMGEVVQARGMVDHAPDAMRDDAGFKAAQAAVELAERRPAPGVVDSLRQAVAANESNHQARFDLAMALFGAGEPEEAMNALLHIVGRDRAWQDDKARLQLLQFFEALGPSDPHTLSGRRKLSSLLFS